MDSVESPPQYSRILAAAVSRIADRLDNFAGKWITTPEEISREFAGIVGDVERICSGHVEGFARVATPKALLHHRLTELLRSEVLSQWRSSSDPSGEEDSRALLTLVWAIEDYRARLWPGGHEDLASRLRDPDALELVVGVAHDLRSPLNSILFLSEVLRSGQSGSVTPHQQSQLGLIYGATMGMVSVVNDVMELARNREGTAKEEPHPFSIGKVFDSVDGMVRPIAEAKGIHLDFSLPDYGRCVGLSGALGRALLNLTTNALKFTEVGGVTVVARRVDRSQVEFSVRDTGRGMTPERQERLFQVFQPSTARSGHFFAQAGLGLSIVRRLVRSMGSELTVESELGKGTVFVFQIELPSV